MRDFRETLTRVGATTASVRVSVRKEKHPAGSYNRGQADHQCILSRSNGTTRRLSMKFVSVPTKDAQVKMPSVLRLRKGVAALPKCNAGMRASKNATHSGFPSMGTLQKQSRRLYSTQQLFTQRPRLQSWRLVSCTADMLTGCTAGCATGGTTCVPDLRRMFNQNMGFHERSHQKKK